MSPTHSPISSPHQAQSSPPNANPPTLSPLNTTYPTRQTPRPPSYARNRMSSYSTTSRVSDSRSRPTSYAFPAFHSSLTYTLVRDFAYSIAHPLHYGAPPEPSEAPSGNSTPANERQRRLSDPSNPTWDSAAGPWGGDGFFSNQQLPQMAYGDGPPYSEDEDLHSPVVVSSRHKKHKSAFAGTGSRQARGRGRSPQQDLEEEDENDLPPNHEGRRNYFTGINGDGTKMYYIGDENESASGPGGELVTYPPDQAPQSLLAPSKYHAPGQRDSHLAATLPNRSYTQGQFSEDSDEDGSGVDPRDSRYSKDYQFTIASPDEEMHGKAVALFDFARENENELPLTEGQIIWVSYRHGQGWLVAEDPKTGDAGLVPEEYVRLLRDIEGGWSSLSGEQATDDSSLASPVTTAHDTAVTPTQAEPARTHTPHNSHGSNSGGEKRPPIVSTFSTSSKDLKPYPHRLLEGQAGGTPPQVVHYGSQSNTPTVTSPSTGPHGLRGFEEIEEIEGAEEEVGTKAER